MTLVADVGYIRLERCLLTAVPSFQSLTSLGVRFGVRFPSV